MSCDSDQSLFCSDNDESFIFSNKVIDEHCEESDVISETPQKGKTKNILKAKTTKSCVKIEHDLEEFCVDRNDVNRLDSISTWCINPRYKSPYVFYEINEILNFKETCQPVNSNIKIFGVYKQNYLLEHKQNCTRILPAKLVIDCKLLHSLPVVDQTVEMYGHLKFYKNSTSCFSAFIVVFWININSDFAKYKNFLRKQKLFVPSCYKDMMKVDPYNNTTCNFYSFDEIDESCLNKNVDCIERMYNEIDEIMNINEEIFA